MRVTFTHDVEHALSTMVDLVNTDPATGGEELLPDVAALEVFVHQHAVSDIGELTQDDLVAVHATRPRLRQIFLAESPRRAASLLNDLLDGAGLRHHARGARTPAALCRTRLRPCARQPVAQPIKALLRQPHLRQ